MVDIADLNLDFLPQDRRGIYLVGGTVRDALLGKQPVDIDLAVDGDIDRTAAAIAARCNGRVVDLGKKGFAVLRVVAASLVVDISPLDGQTIEQDLYRRDFTINAMAYDLAARRVVDCTGGRADLKQKTLRMVSDAAFARDPARLARAYRLAASLQYDISPGTRAVIRRSGRLIDGVAGERIWAELLKLLALPRSAPTVREMAVDGLLTAIFPELTPTIGCIQNRSHQFDVFEHSLRAYAHLEHLLTDAADQMAGRVAARDMAGLEQSAPLIKYAALLHDAGKPATRRIGADGGIAFPGHAGRSAVIAESVSRRLRLSNGQRETAVTVIRSHLRPLFLFRATRRGTLGRRGIVRFFSHCNTLTLPVLVHCMADIMAKQATLQAGDADFIRFCDRLVGDYGAFRSRQALAPPLINGHDLIKIFGLFPAPRFKWILGRVEERRLTGELSTRQDALDWVKAQLASRWADDKQPVRRKA